VVSCRSTSAASAEDECSLTDIGDPPSLFDLIADYTSMARPLLSEDSTTLDIKRLGDGPERPTFEGNCEYVDLHSRLSPISPRADGLRELAAGLPLGVVRNAICFLRSEIAGFGSLPDGACWPSAASSTRPLNLHRDIRRSAPTSGRVSESSGSGCLGTRPPTSSAVSQGGRESRCELAVSVPRSARTAAIFSVLPAHEGRGGTAKPSR
jgi:hypothetical protein